MNNYKIKSSGVAASMACVLTVSSAWAKQEIPSDELESLKRMMREVISENKALTKRVHELETEMTKVKEASTVQQSQTAEKAVTRKIGERRIEVENEDAARSIAKEHKRLEQRVTELETAKTANEDATRWIVQDAFSKLGSKINEYVVFGGTLEMLAGWSEDFSGPSTGDLQLSTAQIDFEIQVNDWSNGSLIFEYISNTDPLFPTTSIFNGGVDRLTLDTASLTIGDTQKFPPFATFGQIILPFGISTGNPVTDVQTIESPLTIEAFEMRNTALGFGVELPTPALAPPPKPIAPPQVKPLLLNPLINSLSKNLGYNPPPMRPPSSTYLTPPPEPPAFNAGVYFFKSALPSANEWNPGKHIDATVGYRTKGHCGLTYEQRHTSEQLSLVEYFCPWSFDVDVDYNSSVFDSRFLAFEYAGFLDQIGQVPGMAAHVKTTLGPVSLIAEWNGAIQKATFFDDTDKAINIKPSAWQVYLGYQFDWNPWVEEIGAQGTFVSLGYSRSYDLAGVTQITDGEANKVGALPKSRFLVSISEWLLDGLRFSIEYSHITDYPVSEGGTGKSANGVFSQMTYVW